MKKYYNKSLIFQYMYLGKWSLLGSGIVLSIVIFSQYLCNIEMLKQNIANLVCNNFYFDYTNIFAFFILLLICFQLVISGSNKRNNLTFLRSCPFSNEEIKFNEILCLTIALLVYSVIYLYFGMVTYFNFKDLILIVPNYMSEVIYNFVRFILVGFLFVLYESIMNMLFSNGIASSIFTILTPFFVLGDLEMIFNSYNLFTHKWIGLRQLSNFLYAILNFMFVNNNNTYINEKITNNIFYKLLGAFVVVALCVAFIVLIRILVKRELINNMNKIFTFNKFQFGMIYLVTCTIIMFVLNFILKIEDPFSTSYIKNLIIYLFFLSIIFVTSYLVSLVIDKKLNKII